MLNGEAVETTRKMEVWLLTQAQARLAMLIMPYRVPDFPCALPRWLLPAAGRDGLGLVDGLLLRLHHTDSQPRSEGKPQRLATWGR